MCVCVCVRINTHKHARTHARTHTHTHTHTRTVETVFLAPALPSAPAPGLPPDLLLATKLPAGSSSAEVPDEDVIPDEEGRLRDNGPLSRLSRLLREAILLLESHRDMALV